MVIVNEHALTVDRKSRADWDAMTPDEQYHYLGLLEVRDAELHHLLELIPECPIHGHECLAHAEAWVMKQFVAPDGSWAVLIRPGEYFLVDAQGNRISRVYALPPINIDGKRQGIVEYRPLDAEATTKR